jgi:lipoprotein-anchoring transpeptidase ErfK/SrfK
VTPANPLFLCRRSRAALSGILASALGLASAAVLVEGRSAGAIEAPPPVPSASSRPAATATTPTTGPAAGAPAAPAAGTTTAAITSNRQIVLELGRRTISLMEDGKVLRSWPVAIGDPSTPTPTGTYRVTNKVMNPQYASTKTGKVNPTVGAQGPLGDRWLGFLRSGPNQFGIHGTPSAWAWTVTSRAAVTNGCVRMLTPHVRELFDKVDVGTPVVVKR